MQKAIENIEALNKKLGNAEVQQIIEQSKAEVDVDSEMSDNEALMWLTKI